MAMTGPRIDPVYNGSDRIPRVTLQPTSVAFVTRLTENTFIAHSQTGAKVGVAPNLRTAQMLIENAYSGNSSVRWSKQTDAAGIERWVANLGAAAGPYGVPDKNIDGTSASTLTNSASTGTSALNTGTGTIQSRNWFKGLGGGMFGSASNVKGGFAGAFSKFRPGFKKTQKTE